MGKNVYVVPHGDKWAMRMENNQRVSETFDRQSDAIAAARERAMQEKSELSILGTNGQIRDKRSYGNDPCPPRDKR